MDELMEARNRRTGGVSLLEVMIAMTVLSFGLLGIGAIQLTSTKLSADSRVRGQAAFLAQQQVETFRSMSIDDVTDLISAAGYPNDPGNPITAGDGTQIRFNRRWIITPDSPEAGVTTITVEVDYVDNIGSTRTVRIQTYKAGS